MTDTDRLAAALDHALAMTTDLRYDGPDAESLAGWAIAADPTLICPDPADHELAAAVRRLERERLRALAMARLPEYGVGPTFSQHGIHGWRCEYPERYGPCECFDEVIKYVFDDPEADR